MPDKPKPARRQGSPRRTRLATVERIVRIAGSIVAVLGALVAIYLKLPGFLRQHPPTGPSPTVVAAPPPPGTATPPPPGTATTPATPTAPAPKPADPQTLRNQPVHPNVTAARLPEATTRATIRTSAYRVFDLAISPGIAYDLENTSNNGWAGDDPGYADRDLYRTSTTAPGDQFQGVQVPVTSSHFNTVAAISAGSPPTACAHTPSTGGGKIPLGTATDGTTFCVRTHGGHWAHVVITAVAGRDAAVKVRVTMPR